MHGTWGAEADTYVGSNCAGADARNSQMLRWRSPETGKMIAAIGDTTCAE
jgi:hypothetical protein